MDKIWFTSDTHYGHANVIKYANRPFKDVQEMNEAMIANWNRVVGHNDIVYHIGDFAFIRNEDDVLAILNRLVGRKILILGNHDRKMTSKVKSQFQFVTPYYELKVQDPDAHNGRQDIVLMHYSMRVWNKSHYGAWQLYGHSHGSLPDMDTMLSMDVGVDCTDYTPISYDQVKAVMKTKRFVPIDHHRGEM